jgi:hypothetical protein
VSALLAALWLAALEPSRTVDFEAALVASHPERFSLCVGVHPARPLEVDLCSSVDRGVTALTGHLFGRKTWSRELTAGRALSVGLGAGAGGRVSSYCPFAACAVAFGPEALVSLEGVLWLTAGFGLTLQLDAGLAAVWSLSAPNVWDWSFRFPARLLIGVAL